MSSLPICRAGKLAETQTPRAERAGMVPAILGGSLKWQIEHTASGSRRKGTFFIFVAVGSRTPQCPRQKNIDNSRLSFRWADEAETEEIREACLQMARDWTAAALRAEGLSRPEIPEPRDHRPPSRKVQLSFCKSDHPFRRSSLRSH